MAIDEADISSLRETLVKELKEHSPTMDSIYHNGGTLLALMATGAATIIPASYSFWIKVSAAIATFIIALTRALDFGGRWRWHIEMKNGYQALIDRTDELRVLPDDEKL